MKSGRASPASSHLRSAARAAVDLVLPPRCLWCSDEREEFTGGILLCTECRPVLTGASVARCLRCGLAAAANATGSCGFCIREPQKYSAVVPLGTYADSLRQCILRLKHVGHEPLARAMGQLLAAERGAELRGAQADVILPVPMHWFRRMIRRTNSAEFVAAAMADALRIPIANRVLSRTRNTRKQGPMLRTQRLDNVRGAFRVRDPASIRGRRILLVDDILTTGATCNEIAKVLLRAGATSVAVAVLARADGH